MLDLIAITLSIICVTSTFINYVQLQKVKDLRKEFAHTDSIYRKRLKELELSFLAIDTKIKNELPVPSGRFKTEPNHLGNSFE